MQLYTLVKFAFLLSNEFDKMLFISFYFNSTVLYILFHLLQPMTVYPFAHTKELKQFMNMYTTSSIVKM